MNSLQTFWQARTRRERRLLIVMAALALPILLWLALIRPLGAARLRAESQLAAATADTAVLQAARTALATAPQSASDPVMPRLQAAVAAAGLSLASLDPAGPNGATARIAAARAPVLLRLIAALEAEGLVITSLSISRNEDTSVNAQFTANGPAA
jgi:general secretion pathway protein M